MKVFVKRIMFGLLVFSLLAWIAAAVGVTGIWEGTCSNPAGNSHPVTFTLQENAGAVTGTETGFPSGVEDPQAISSGKVSGDQLSFDVILTSPGGDKLTVNFAGKISGNQIQGSFTGDTPKGQVLTVTVTKK